MSEVIVERSFKWCRVLLGAVAALGLLAMSACSHLVEGRKMVEQNRQIAVDAMSKVFNERRYEVASRYFAPSFRSHNPQIPAGPEGVVQFVRQFSKGFPDARGEVLDVIAERDKVAIHIRWQGTHQGPFGGVAPTGRRIEFEAVEIFRLQDGRIVEHWDVADRLALRVGLGGS
jgi:predicted SnoaL-like aldol condensation-catalyzing enzyme